MDGKILYGRQNGRHLFLAENGAFLLVDESHVTITKKMEKKLDLQNFSF